MSEEKAPEELLAGKFKTVDDLVQGYKNSSQSAIELKKELNQATETLQSYKAPESYDLPEDIYLPEAEKDLLIELAKTSELPKQHFERLAKNYATKTAAEKEASQKAAEDAKASHDENEYKIIETYINDNYPEEVREKLSLSDEKIYNYFKNERAKKVSNKMPGVDSPGSAPVSTAPSKDELATAYQEAKKNNPESRRRYIDLIKQKSASK